MAEITYYFNSMHATFRWETSPGNMIDGILTNYASTATDGDQEVLPTTTCPGSDLGTITKVEIRVYAYGDGDDRIDLAFTVAMTPEYQITPGASPGWTGYVDVTGDPYNSPWTWAKIKDLVGYLCVEKDNVGKGNVMYCAKVEIRVTFTPAVAVPRHGFVLFQEPAVV